jgi:carbamoyltransferase
MRKFDRILTSALRTFPRSWRAFPHAVRNSLGVKVWVRGIISSHLGVPRSKIMFTGHHYSHAAAAFLASPTTRAAILTADSVGEWATLTVGARRATAGWSSVITLLRSSISATELFRRDCRSAGPSFDYSKEGSSQCASW